MAERLESAFLRGLVSSHFMYGLAEATVTLEGPGYRETRDLDVNGGFEFTGVRRAARFAEGLVEPRIPSVCARSESRERRSPPEMSGESFRP